MAHDYFSRGICSVYLFIADYRYAGVSNINISALKDISEPPRAQELGVMSQRTWVAWL